MMSEEALTEAIEAAEEAGDVGALVAALAQCCAAPDDLGTAAEAAADALDRVVTAGDTATYDRGAAVKAVVAALEAFVDEAAIVEVLLSCVRRLAPDAAAAACFRGSAASVVAAMAVHESGEPTVQEQGCLAVEALALAGASAELRAAGAEGALDRAAQAIVNERNKSYPEKALAALGGAAAERC